MVSTNAHTVIVAGAGPVGLAAALVLDELGLDITVVAPGGPAGDERTSALLAGSVAFLERIGVWAGVEGSAAPLRSLRIVDATKRLVRAPEVIFHAADIGLDAFGFNVPNRALLASLESEVGRRRRIKRAVATVDDVVADANGVTARLSPDDSVTASLIVAADGRRSRVRECVGIDVRSWRYDQSAMVVNVDHALDHRDTSTEFHTEAGPFTLVPLPGRRSSLVWVDRSDEVSRRAALPDDLLAAEIEARAASILGRMTIAGARQVFPLAGMNAKALANNRTVLVGEAAHVFPPIGAQGLNLGYRDVAALAEVLAGAPADPGAESRLRTYDRLRRGDILTRTAAVDMLNRTLLNDFLPVAGLRGLGLFLLDRVPAMRRALMRRGIG